MNRRTFANLLAAGLVMPPVSATAVPETPEAMIPFPGMTMRQGVLEFRTLADGTREYRIRWSDGHLEPITPEAWKARYGYFDEDDPLLREYQA